MKSIVMCIWLLGAAITGIGLYGIAYEVEQMEKDLSALKREIIEERETTHVLEAEWAYLARPERIEELSRQYLPRMQSLTAERIGGYDDLPYQPLPDVLDALQPEKLATPGDARATQ
jgi:cell division protein FtsL